MDYDINEKETSIDNMGDSLLIALENAVNSDNYANADAIMSEWIVDGVDPVGGNYEFIFIPNFTLQWWRKQKRSSLHCIKLTALKHS